MAASAPLQTIHTAIAAFATADAAVVIAYSIVVAIDLLTSFRHIYYYLVQNLHLALVRLPLEFEDGIFLIQIKTVPVSGNICERHVRPIVI